MPKRIWTRKTLSIIARNSEILTTKLVGELDPGLEPTQNTHQRRISQCKKIRITSGTKDRERNEQQAHSKNHGKSHLASQRKYCKTTYHDHMSMANPVNFEKICL
nr:PREDICTED: uncharacterized protein LOC109033261 [Bemisia tabaci]